MTGQEMLVYLINKRLIHKIGTEYVPTSEVRGLLSNLESVNILDVEEPTEVNISLLYPEDIRNSSELNRVKALLDYCEVPLMSSNGSKYMLRSMDKNSTLALLNMMSDVSIKPAILIECITSYYENIDYPKSVKRLVLEGDLMDLYMANEKGESLDDGPINTSTWI